MISQDVCIDNGNNAYAIHFPGEGIPGRVDNVNGVSKGGGESHCGGTKALDQVKILNKGSGD